MTLQPTQLFEVEIRVQTTPEHPQFQKFQCGMLSVWLYAADVKSAGESAIQIARTLPFKLGPAQSFPIDGAENLKDWQIDGAAEASHTTPKMLFHGFATEEELSAELGPDWPFLVPLIKPPI
jgi:hypothetical protein